MVAIASLPANSDLAEIAGQLDQAGAVILTDACPSAQREAIVAELDAHVAAARLITEDDPAAFYPGHTRRVTALIARSAAVRELVRHPLLMGLSDHFLLPNCERYQLHVASALVVGPGARSQVLHREDDSYPFFAVPRPHLVLASLWAMSSFTADNGGTLLVPGSHRWEAGREARSQEVVAAEMPAGAVLIWLGGTLHGAGANRTADKWRYGVFLSYSLGWLRQEENQYLDVPPAIAEDLDPELRALVGYAPHSGLGFYDPRVAGEGGRRS